MLGSSSASHSSRWALYHRPIDVLLTYDLSFSSILERTREYFGSKHVVYPPDSVRPGRHMYETADSRLRLFNLLYSATLPSCSRRVSGPLLTASVLRQAKLARSSLRWRSIPLPKILGLLTSYGVCTWLLSIIYFR